MRAPLLTGLLATVTVACATPGSTLHHASAGPAEALPFIENDYPRALEQARAQGLPLFVDVWAPW